MMIALNTDLETELRQARIQITELQRALDDMSRSTRDGQRVAKIGNWELNLVNKELFWSEEIFNIFELSPSEFKASYEAFLAAVHPEDRDTVNEAYLSSVKNKQSYDMVHRLLMADGRIKYVRECGETEYDGDTPIRSIGTVQDITEKKIVEDELKLYRQHLEEVIESRTKDLHKEITERRHPRNVG